MSLSLFKKFEKSKVNFVLVNFSKQYSRKNNNNNGPFKVVQPRKAVKDVVSAANANYNFELLALTKGFPFFMPGNIGPAWHDKYTTVRRNSLQIEDSKITSFGNVDCQIQACPKVLRDTVCELFPNKNLDNSELSVVTLTMRPDIKLMRFNKELETEKMAQVFVLAAENICRKLQKAGYWADFINPFSGRPYICPPPKDGALYATDEKFRCLDFQIITIQQCKIITNEEDKQSKKRFVGSLFTNAPSKKSYMDPIFNRDDV